METLFYLVLGAVLYTILADRMDEAVDREMRRRRPRAHLRLVDDSTPEADRIREPAETR